jgi:quinol monooxygenase YgiN
VSEIIVSGYAVLAPEKRAGALNAATPLFDGTRAQAGCIAYVWCADPVEPSRIWVYERWANEASLAAHLAGPFYKGMLAALASGGLKGAQVAKHRIERSGAIYDPKGVARADFFESGS